MTDKTIASEGTADFEDPWSMSTARLHEFLKSEADIFMESVLASTAKDCPTLDLEPGRILLVGDLHGHSDSGCQVIRHAAEIGIKVIVALGDFGWWPERTRGQDFIIDLERELSAADIRMVWIDGNHESFWTLDEIPCDANGLRPISDRITHLPRGYRWTWNGRKWLALGGATSLDRPGRVEGFSWFPDEEITDEEADSIIAAGPADVMITHDSPSDYIACIQGNPNRFALEEVQRADVHRARLQRVVSAVRPMIVYHGHYHVRFTSRMVLPGGGYVVTEGLGRDRDPMEDLVLEVQ